MSGLWLVQNGSSRSSSLLTVSEYACSRTDCTVNNQAKSRTNVLASGHLHTVTSGTSNSSINTLCRVDGFVTFHDSESCYYLHGMDLVQHIYECLVWNGYILYCTGCVHFGFCDLLQVHLLAWIHGTTFLCVCMCVCLYVCMYVCSMYVRMYVCMCVFMYYVCM